MYGALDYHEGDYVVIPHGTIYRVLMDAMPQRWLLIESRRRIETPKRYRNEYGQLLEHSPFCERDIRRPTAPLTRAERGRVRGADQGRGPLQRLHLRAPPASTWSAGTAISSPGS